MLMISLFQLVNNFNYFLGLLQCLAAYELMVSTVTLN